MTNVKGKLERLGKVHTVAYGDGAHSNRLYAKVQDMDSGVLVASENSMIDTRSISTVYFGRVNPLSVNLETMSGRNTPVLAIIELMLSKPGCTFFPGTLLRAYGGYSLPIMPIIQDGKLISERAKLTGIPYVDDSTELAKILFGEEFAQKVRGSNGLTFEEPLKTLYERLEEETKAKRILSFGTVDINGLTTLPIICNELTNLSTDYEGAALDVIVHSAGDLFKDNEDLTARYETNLARLAKKRKLHEPTIVISAEGGEKRLHSGLYVFAEGKLTEA
ncbi:MAG: hypothetical protein ABIE22_01610 [archaeon]